MSDLLSASESQQIHSFLSAIDYSAPNDTKAVSSTEWTHYSDEGIPLPQPPHGKGKEALAKATKHLMSLDSSSWGASPSVNNYQGSHGSYIFDSHQSDSSQYGFESSRNTSQNSPYHTPHSQRGPSVPTSVTFPFLSKQHPFPPPSASTQSRSDSPGSTTQSLGQVTPVHITTGVNHSGIRPNSANSPIGTSPSSASSFSSHNSSTGASSTTLSSLPNTDIAPVSDASESTNCNNKRTLDSSPQPSNSKRHRTSPPSTSGSTVKSSLLSPSQKKANHIQSEQKRRANIRRGYEALCETVPALREAIRQEEETQQKNGVNGSKGPAKARHGRGRGKVDEGTGEKIDGRAGPRSENIVLVKTIEYINELLKDREALLGRLRRVQLSLGPSHLSGATSNSVPPLWERVWNGGSGKDADAEDDDDEDVDE